MLFCVLRHFKLRHFLFYTLGIVPLLKYGKILNSSHNPVIHQLNLILSFLCSRANYKNVIPFKISLLCNVRVGSNIFQYQIKSGLITERKNPLSSKQKKEKEMFFFWFTISVLADCHTKSEADLIFFVWNKNRRYSFSKTLHILLRFMVCF